MVYKRKDGRKLDELREMEAKVGVVKTADGSAMFRIGNTIAIAVVRGPRELFPGFLQNSQKGLLRCHYDMSSFSVTDRKRPGPSRRSIEISNVTRDSLLPVLDLRKYPNTVVDIFVEITQADAGTRCAGICAAAMALADAGLIMKDLVAAVSLGKVGDTLVVDVDKSEEDHEDGATDIPVAIIPRKGEISLLQLDGEISPKQLKEGLVMVSKACKDIYELQKKALKSKYEGVGKWI